MRLNEEFDFTMEQALQYFENVDARIYGENMFGYSTPIQDMLNDVYNTWNIFVGPEFIIVDEQYLYDTPIWMADFMYAAIRQGHDSYVSHYWIKDQLRKMLDCRV